MKIAILGSGGREHAIALQISKSKKLEKLYCIPGNAGTKSIAINKIGLDLKLISYKTNKDEILKTYIHDNFSNSTLQ